MNKIHPILLAASVLLASAAAHAQTAPDNTKSNALDATNRSASADKQKNDPTDLALIRQIRASLIADKSLSTYAHNVKIVSIDGNVTLSGVVRSEQEKEVVASKAKAALGGGGLIDNLRVQP